MKWLRGHWILWMVTAEVTHWFHDADKWTNVYLVMFFWSLAALSFSGKPVTPSAEAPGLWNRSCRDSPSMTRSKTR